jgi:hypothetical protein
MLRRPLLVLAAGALVTLLAALSPLLLRRFDAFRVRQVEVMGAQLLPAAEALELSGITDSVSLFDDLEPWRLRLLSHRLVEAARLERRLPGTLRIVVTETEPVALAQAAGLRAVDARGRLLPVHLAGAVLDVPVVAGPAHFGADSVLGPPAAGLVQAFVTIRRLDAELAGAVSEIATARGGGIRLVMTWPRHPELLLPEAPEARTFHQIREVLEHLRHGAAGDTTAAAAAPPIDRLARIDARYRDELFVSFHSR